MLQPIGAQRERENHPTCPLRICQDSSMKTDNGISLNEAQFKGESLLRKIPEQILTFRRNEIQIQAYIASMFTNVEVLPSEKSYQRTVLKDETGHIREFQNETVVFGERSSPFNACMVLKKLADEYREDYPIGSYEVENNFYCDDWGSSAESESNAMRKIYETNKVTSRGNMTMRKHVSNLQEILRDLPQEQCFFPKNDDKSVVHRTSILGYNWTSQPDNYLSIRSHFEFLIKDTKLTKRQGAAIVGKLYDPMRLCGTDIDGWEKINAKNVARRKRFNSFGES